jgi:hypothetical protein
LIAAAAILNGSRRHYAVGEAERFPFDMSAIRAFAKYIFTIFVLGCLGFAGFRASRDRRPRSRGATPLVSTQS